MYGEKSKTWSKTLRHKSSFPEKEKESHLWKKIKSPICKKEMAKTEKK
jgi:hypothetical protein